MRLHLAIQNLSITRFLESRDSASRRYLAMPAPHLVPPVAGACARLEREVRRDVETNKKRDAGAILVDVGAMSECDAEV